MARVAGVDIPENKQVWVSLQYIYGIGKTRSFQIIEKANVEATTRISDLTDDELKTIRDIVEKEYRVEGDLRKEVNLNIKRLMDIGCYRGLRHRHNLPAHGQRTKTNARTRRGKAKTVAGRGQKRGAAKK